MTLQLHHSGLTSHLNSTERRVVVGYRAQFFYVNELGLNNGIGGIEWQLVEAIAEIENLSIALQPIGDDKADLNILIGAFSLLHGTDAWLPSVPYLADDLTWCVQRAKLKPEFLNAMLLFSPTVWVILTITLYFVGFCYYFLLLFNDEKQRMYDIHYCVFCISMRSIIGSSVALDLKRWHIRLFYLNLTFFSIALFGISFTRIMAVLEDRHRFEQTKTIQSLEDYDFALAGSLDVRNALLCRRKVRDLAN